MPSRRILYDDSTVDSHRLVLADIHHQKSTLDDFSRFNLESDEVDDSDAVVTA